MKQVDFLSELSINNVDAVIIGSIGTISYDLDKIVHTNKILIRGAMGSAIGCGLGYALSSEEQVIVVIGDGSFMMHMSSMANVLKYNLPNLRIIVLNNNSFKSCGGQKTNFEWVRKHCPFEIIDVE